MMPSAIALAAATGLPEISHRESDDGYAGVVVQLNARWRVIECRDRVQWILQHRISATGRATQSDWRGRSYLRTRDALLRCVHDHAGSVSADALATLQQLPTRFPEGPRP